MADDFCTLPYLDAVRQRMEPLGEPLGNLKGRRESTFSAHAITRTSRVLTLARQDGLLVGTELSGSVLCRLRLDVEGHTSAGTLCKHLANALNSDTGAFTLFHGDRALGDEENVELLDQMVARQTVEEPTIFVCNVHERVEARLGEASVHLHLPETPVLQAVLEPHKFITGCEDRLWLVYSKREVSAARASRHEPLEPVGVFPRQPPWPLPPGARRWGGPRCDVWSTTTCIPCVRPLLDAHAARTNDRPIPRYQMVVDPNQFARADADGRSTWVPCEFDVSANCSAKLLGGRCSHRFPELAAKVATPVLEAALPLLARLNRPRLLLEGRRLQVVFKAQRIIVPAQVSESVDSEYIGLWHVDGHVEHVAAVVLFYYQVDSALKGGDMEFCGREPMDVLGWGDCSNNYRRFSTELVREALRDPSRGVGGQTAVNNCRVPITDGTMLVFSNYQMIHRVLRMVNTSADREASRDFVALFVLDPAAAPLLPARLVLAEAYLLHRTLSASGLFTSKRVRQILEYAGKLESKGALQRSRNQMLWEQLQPQGCFGADEGPVYSTGNGCYTMIGWLRHMLDRPPGPYDDDHPSWLKLRGLRLPPQEVERGMSELLSASTEDVQLRLEYECACEGGAATCDNLL